MTDMQVRSDEARRNLRNLLDQVEARGARIMILRYDKPAAVLVPVDWYEEAQALIARDDQQYDTEHDAESKP